MDNRTLYITADEFKSAPTAVDTANLDQENIGNADAQLNELNLVLRRASRWVDNICHQTLLASNYTETKALTPTRDNRIVIHPNYTPLHSVTSIKFKRIPSDSWVTVNLDDAYQQYESWFEFYGSTYYLNTFGYFPTRLMVQYSYTAGFAVTTLSSDSNIDDTTLTVDDVTGISEGTIFTVGVGVNAEYVTASSVSGNVVTLKSAMLLAHSAGDVVSALPDDIRQAVIMLAGFLIRERGSMAVTMNETTLTSSSSYAKSDDVKLVTQILSPYMRVISS